MTTESKLIKKSISDILGVDIKYVGIKKNKHGYNAGVGNDFFCDAQNNKRIDTDWNNLTNAEYTEVKIKQASSLEDKTGFLVSVLTNKGNFDFYRVSK